MNHRIQLGTPWARPGDPYSTPGSLILKLALGEAPEKIASALDLRQGTGQASATTGIGPVDRLLGHFSTQAQVYRVHASAQGFGRPGQRHKNFNDLEHAVGLSRTFEVDLDDDSPILDLIDALRHLAVVEQAYPHYLCVLPFGTAAPAAIGIDEAWSSREMIGAAEAMAYEPGDAAVVVAIVDTGVMLDHPELAGHVRRGYDTVQLTGTDLPPGMKLVTDQSRGWGDPVDLVGHGTSCAGIIGASGEQIPPGLAGNCGVLPLRVLGSAKYPGKADPVGIGAVADIDCGVKYAIDLGAKVLNFSFGTPEAEIEPNGPMPHSDVIAYGLARGCIMVAASGNSGKEERFSPAAMEGVIAVGSVDENGAPSAFSTRGGHVALSAPGESVVSSSLHGYSRVTGTSFAAPSVSAAAALLVSRALGRAYPLDAGDARRILCDSARPWRTGHGKGGGAGVLDAVAALQQLDREIDGSEQAAPNDRRKARGHTG
ncbi:MAG TPA: S8 family serine peptidase [Candidatus Acidoferrales bacterium]|jgi:subtilisin family serine protease|nr:S8 family serine peptidase [Candidatus Acidoferrales bacterium]